MHISRYVCDAVPITRVILLHEWQVLLVLETWASSPFLCEQHYSVKMWSFAIPGVLGALWIIVLVVCTEHALGQVLIVDEGYVLLRQDPVGLGMKEVCKW